MTAKNCTTKKRGKQPSIGIGDKYINRQGLVATVVDYKNKSNVLVRFDDEPRATCTFYASSLRAGSFKNPYYPSVFGVGYFGVGEYKSHHGEGRSHEYATWQDMLRRCYDGSYLTRNPSYIGCSVHPDWHNFQVFAEWLTSNKFYGLGYQLDKDLLVEGNRCYSPDACSLIPLELNTLLTSCATARGLHPQGVYFCKSSKKYKAMIRFDAKKTALGLYGSAKEASKVYRLAKSTYIKGKAVEWKGRIDNDVFDSLIKIADKFLED